MTPGVQITRNFPGVGRISCDRDASSSHHSKFSAGILGILVVRRCSGVSGELRREFFGRVGNSFASGVGDRATCHPLAARRTCSADSKGGTHDDSHHPQSGDDARRGLLRRWRLPRLGLNGRQREPPRPAGDPCSARGCAIGQRAPSATSGARLVTPTTAPGETRREATVGRQRDPAIPVSLTTTPITPTTNDHHDHHHNQRKDIADVPEHEHRLPTARGS